MVCEHRTVHLSCPGGKLISIQSATYGRSKNNFKTCYRGSLRNILTRLRVAIRSCRSGRSHSKMAQYCNGKQRCSVAASNGIFGDPCRGVFKYLQVNYICHGGNIFIFIFFVFKNTENFQVKICLNILN